MLFAPGGYTLIAPWRLIGLNCLWEDLALSFKWLILAAAQRPYFVSSLPFPTLAQNSQPKTVLKAASHAFA
eukprot:3635453-Amphidinium_carterae.1